MRIVNCVALFLPFFTVNFVSAQNQSPGSLDTLLEAYQAATNNLVSGSGTGSYEIYAAPPGKGTRQELHLKAKTKVFFDRGKFHIRFDYEKDDIHHLDSRIIIYDGTAILVSRKSDRIRPAGSEGDIYAGTPTHQTLVEACFDYNPCQLPSSFLHVDWLSDPKYASNLAITQDANNDYSGSYVFTKDPHHLHATFLASHSSGYNINTYRLFYPDSINHPYKTCHAEWEQKKNVWFVKSIDLKESWLNGGSERSIFKYTDFEPNVEVSPSLFKFDSLDLAPNARLIDRRPNADTPVLHQSKPAKEVEAKLNTLADKVKYMKSHPPPIHRAKRIPSPRHIQQTWKKYLALFGGFLLCVAGLILLWKRRRQRKGDS